MSFLVELYEKFLHAVIDENKINSYNTNKQEHVIVCNCNIECGQQCKCRCHFHSCQKCDLENCDFLESCPCNCHEEDRKNMIIFKNRDANMNINNQKNDPNKSGNSIINLKSNNVRGILQKNKKNIFLKENTSNLHNTSGLNHSNNNLTNENIGYVAVPNNNMSEYNLFDMSSQMGVQSVNNVRSNNGEFSGPMRESPKMLDGRYADQFSIKSEFMHPQPQPHFRQSSDNLNKYKKNEENILWNDENNDDRNLNSFRLEGDTSPKLQRRRSKLFSPDKMEEKIKRKLSVEETITEKEKLKTRRHSKYTQMINDIPDPQQEEKLKNLIKEHTQANNLHEIKKDQRLSLLQYKENKKKNNGILKFDKAKFNRKKVPQDDNNLFNTIDPKTEEKPGLSSTMKANFEQTKIKNLENPNSQDALNENRYIRDKTPITQGMNKLREEIHNENYNNKKKLSLNVFEDFEKQTSWQSYTILLITDIDNVNDKKDILAKKGLTKNLSKTGSKK